MSVLGKAEQRPSGVWQSVLTYLCNSSSSEELGGSDEVCFGSWRAILAKNPK
jgi:hypothetical protein